MTDWREMVSDEAMPLGHQQAAELPTEEGACLACGTPLQLCGHSGQPGIATEEAEHARICSLPFGHQGGHWWDEEQEPPPIGARCADPDCDGEAGHDGPHFQWIPE